MNPPDAMPSSAQLYTTLFIRGKYLDYRRSKQYSRDFPQDCVIPRNIWHMVDWLVTLTDWCAGVWACFLESHGECCYEESSKKQFS